MSEKIKFLWCVAKNGLCEPYKLKIVKEGKKTFTTDELVGKRVFKAYECESPLVGYNTYCFYYNNEEFALKQFNYLKEKNNNTTHKQITELKQQLADKDEEIARLKETITLLNQNAYNAEVADANAIHELEFVKSQYENIIEELEQQLKVARQQIEKGD